VAGRGQGLLLDLADDPGLRAAAAGWAGRVQVVTSACPERPALAALLVRPDGYVAWAADTRDGEADPRDGEADPRGIPADTDDASADPEMPCTTGSASRFPPLRPARPGRPCTQAIDFLSWGHGLSHART
jgi:hypothetical protein